MLFLTMVHAESGLPQGYDRIPEYFPSKLRNKITLTNIFFQYGGILSPVPGVIDLLHNLSMLPALASVLAAHHVLFSAQP